MRQVVFRALDEKKNPRKTVNNSGLTAVKSMDKFKTSHF